MKRLWLLALFTIASTIAIAADVTPAAKPTVPPTPVSGAPNFCDVCYSGEGEDADGNDIGTSIICLKAVPWADILDNHQKNLRILDKMSKVQDKGGPYTSQVAEVRACDGGNNVKIPEGSLFVKGVTLEGSTEVTDVGIQVAKEINDRYKARVKAGAKTGWNHKNAPKVERVDLGNRIPPGLQKKKQ